MIDSYLRRKTSSILKTDSKIAIIGKVIEVFENSFVLEDETGRIEILSNGEVKKGDLVKVFCSRVDDNFKLDFLQNLKGFDLNLFKKVEELYKKEGLNV